MGTNDDIFALLRGHDVLLAEVQRGSYLIDEQSLQKLDGLLRSLHSQIERLRDSLVVVLDRDPPLTRASLKELKSARERLDRRLKYLSTEVARSHREGVDPKDTMLDRKEIGALGLTLPILDAMIVQAERENRLYPGGKRVRDLPPDAKVPGMPPP